MTLKVSQVPVLESAPWYAPHVLNLVGTCLPTGVRALRTNGMSCIAAMLDKYCTHIFDRWLYSLFLGIDANFRLKRKTVSNETADPSLCEGWAYFVKEEPFKEHLLQHVNQPVEVCCLSLDPSALLNSDCVLEINL